MQQLKKSMIHRSQSWVTGVLSRRSREPGDEKFSKVLDECHALGFEFHRGVILETNVKIYAITINIGVGVVVV